MTRPCQRAAAPRMRQPCGTGRGVAAPRPILEWELATAETEPQTRADRLRAQRRALPDAPGVYLFRDDRRRVLYVGKAKSLRKRVAGHFSNPSTRGAGGLLEEMSSIEFIATETEAEAL